jgi:hypothetical protein
MEYSVQSRFEELPNLGVMLAQVPSNILETLKTRINKMIDDSFEGEQDHRAELLGHLDREYNLEDLIPEIEPFMLALVHKYGTKWDFQYNNQTFKGQGKIRLTNLWVNFQKKYDFNPAHTHSGVLSFALWVTIPYKAADEEQIYPVVGGGITRTSKFTFHYSTITGEHWSFSLPVDESYEGTLALFPAKLTHSVNPFYTSDGYRISVSGNLRFEIE